MGCRRGARGLGHGACTRLPYRRLCAARRQRAREGLADGQRRAGLARALGHDVRIELANQRARDGRGDWVTYMKNLKARPPMPWWSIRETSEDDLRAMHAYIKQLGPGAETAVHPVSNASKVRREPK